MSVAPRSGDIEDMVRSIVPEDGEYLSGFADLRGLLSDRYRRCPYCVVVGKRLDDRVVDSIRHGPNLDYYDLYKSTNRELSSLLRRIDRSLRRHGVETIVVEPTVRDDELDEGYAKTLRTDFSHKMAGTRAGLGWIGKTDLFVSERFGPRLRLATLLMATPVRPDAPPVDESGCGSCRECVDACPAEAANGDGWAVGVDRDRFFDAFKCRQKCLELSMRNMHLRKSLCGICISVCQMGKVR